MYTVALKVDVKCVLVLFGDVPVDIPVIHLVLAGDSVVDFEAVSKSPTHILKETKVRADLAYIDVHTKACEYDDDESDIHNTSHSQIPIFRFHLEMEGMEYNWWKNCRGRAFGKWCILYEQGECYLLIIFDANGEPLSICEKGKQ